MKSKFSLRTFLAIGLAAGIASLVFFLYIPGDPKNAWLLGLSKSRIAMLAASFLMVAGAAVFVQRFLKDEARYGRINQRIEQIFKWEGHRTTGLVGSLAGFLGGGYFLLITFTTTDQFVLGYFLRLAPWVFWLTILCGAGLLFLILHNPQETKIYWQKHGIKLLVLLLILGAGIGMYDYLWELPVETWDVHKMFNQDNKFDLEQQDIYEVYTEGGRLQQGENPYGRVLEAEDFQWNQANATYLPVFYILSWATREIGLESYLQWLGFWRVVFLISNLGIAYLLFYIPYHRYHSLGLACFATLFWLFDRWTLHLTMIYHIDGVALFFFLLSLANWPKHRILSLLAFGLSLGVKQMALFMIPIYLIWIWQSLENRSLKRFLALTLVMAAIPLVVSTPFLVWNAEGFIKSILISATRNAESHFGIPSVDVLLGLSGIPAKLPMLGLMSVVYLLAWKRKLQPFMAGLLIMAAFIDFNSVLFRQYMAWAVPLIPLAVAPLMILQRGEIVENEAR